jgi:hypothetical protein
MLTENQALARYRGWLTGRIAEALKSLLETRHLYQSVSVEHDDLLGHMLRELDGDTHNRLKALIPEIHSYPWYPQGGAPSLEKMLARSRQAEKLLEFKVQDVKLYCTVCGRIEPFNAYSSTDFVENRPFATRLPQGGEAIQAFILSFHCQSCKGIPEVFLVRRSVLKLTICGRSPMEHVEEPSIIPKGVAKFYSGAVLAHQSGQTLAGLFYLRTLIEQWVSHAGAAGEKADQKLDSYVAALPKDFKDRFPSLRSVYGVLSDAIHTATASDDLFVKSAGQIVEHFEARRLFKLP